jgi:hypothetical protein
MDRWMEDRVGGISQKIDNGGIGNEEEMKRSRQGKAWQGLSHLSSWVLGPCYGACMCVCVYVFVYRYVCTHPSIHSSMHAD